MPPITVDHKIRHEEGGRGLAKLSSKSLLAIALVLSLVTVSLVYTFLQSATTKTVSSEGEIVLVAKTNIPARTRVSHEMIQELQVPPRYIQPGAMRETPKAVGTMTRETIIAGEQLTERRLLLDGKYAGFSGVIPPGKRAITVAASEVTGVAGLLKAGDYVDVLVTFDQQTVGESVTKIAMQNVMVLSVNRENMSSMDEATVKKETSKDSAMSKVMNVTLAVSPEDAARITMAEEKGKVRFALRPYFSETATYIPQPVYPADLVGMQQSRKQSGTSTPTATPVISSKSSGNSNGIPVIRGTKIE